MGIPYKNPKCPRHVRGALLVVALSLLAGCETDRNPRVVSAKEFETTKLESLRVLASKLDVLKAIFPTTLDSVLLNTTRADAVPLGTVTAEDLLVYEANSVALVSIDLCETCSASSFRRSAVTMHWSREGLADDLVNEWGVQTINPGIGFELPGTPPVPGVPPIPLRGGDLGQNRFRDWFLAFETNSGSILAFKKEREYRRVSDGQGEPFEQDPTTSPNFGHGNGLLMSVVIRGAEIRSLVGPTARISRIVELDSRVDPDSGEFLDLVVLLFTTVPQVHLLEITFQERELDYNLECTMDPLCPEEDRDIRAVRVPVGRLRTFDGGQEPFLTYEFIQQEVTQSSDIELDDFQPVYLPPDGSTSCEDSGEVLEEGGSVLVYDAGSLSFLRVSENFGFDPQTGRSTPERLGRGNISMAVSTEELLGHLDTEPPFLMSQGANQPGCNPVLIFEEHSNNLLSFTFPPLNAELASPEDRGFTISSGATDFLLRRLPDVVREEGVPASDETVLKVASNNIDGSRLYFDGGQDQLLAVHFETGNVVIVIDRKEFEAVTGEPLSELTWIERLPPSPERQGGHLIRAFDSNSTSLLDISLIDIVLPEEDREN